jgi:hypothetical protein
VRKIIKRQKLQLRSSGSGPELRIQYSKNKINLLKSNYPYSNYIYKTVAANRHMA